jgi:hypothetical protein
MSKPRQCIENGVLQGLRVGRPSCRAAYPAPLLDHKRGQDQRQPGQQDLLGAPVPCPPDVEPVGIRVMTESATERSQRQSAFCRTSSAARRSAGGSVAGAARHSQEGLVAHQPSPSWAGQVYSRNWACASRGLRRTRAQ